MNFLNISEGVYVNTANILKLVTTTESVTIHLVGQATPVTLVANDPEGVKKWLEWLLTNTVNLANGLKTK
ncbi:MAG: hypothetical protein QM703_28765 [Gemmatales bacterium]